jgi:N-acetylmuramoyl-L-alanine amidase
VNAVGGNYIDTSYMTYLKSVQLSNSGNLINITIGKSSTAKYSVAQNNTAYIICLSDSGTSDIGGNENTAGSGETGLQIKLPDGVNFSDIQDVDRYYDNEIAIILPGDYSDFYNNNPVSVLSSVVTNTSVGNNDDGMTEITISTSRLQGYKLKENNGSIDVTLGEPRDIYKSIVVLDPGHGGDAPGAMRSLNGVMVYEKDVNLAILYEKGNKYFNSKDSKIKVYYTRQDDSSVSLTDRAVFADKVGADIFVSLHMNTSTNTTVKGTDVYYSTVNTSVADSGLTSKNLAEFLINYLPDEVGTVKRSAINSKLAVNKNNVVPASLIELTFMSTKSELSRIVDEDFQDNTARAIYDALCALFEEYPTGR